MNTNELWQSVLGELELALSKANFTTWFKQTFIVSLQEGEVIIGVPNMFTKAWLEKKYTKEILQSIQNLSGVKVRNICYRVDTRPVTASIPVSETVAAPAVVSSQVTALPESTVLSTAPAFVNQSPQRFGEFSLNAKYIFENYIVGKQNELAHAASQAVSTQPGGVYHPLFIYGGVGLGKTHLLQAIGNELLRKNPQIRVL